MKNTKETVLKIENIYKSFTATKAVVDVSLEFYKGEVRGLIGENGSGKSTLASIIAGVLRKDSGEMYLDGDEYAPQNKLEANKSHVSMLVQEMGTIDGLSVADNIFLGKESLFSKYTIVSQKKMIFDAEKALAEIGASHIDPSKNVDDISFENRKLVEIASAIYIQPKILIFDETTTALSQKSRDQVYELIKRLKANGQTVIFISHDLQEVKDTCDTVSVLRDGYLVETLNIQDATIDAMRQLMIGRDLSGHYYRTDECSDYEDDVVLEVENLSFDNIFHNINFELHKGEILGIGGLTECGMHELSKVMFGLMKPTSGKVVLPQAGKQITNAREALANNMALIPKDREKEGIMIRSSIKDNIVLMALDKLRKGPYISKSSETRLAKEQSDILEIKMADINQLCSELSGGNKQKVVVSKWLANDSQIFIVDCPTRGIDVGVKSAIYDLMVSMKAEGRSIIMISEEMPELMGMSDRIIILKDGAMSGTLLRENGFNELEIINMMI